MLFVFVVCYRAEYVTGDFRFAGAGFDKVNSKQTLKIWALKEFRNLTRMRKEGITCPRPLIVKDNVLLMEFVGMEGRPAPQLREAAQRMSKRRLNACYHQLALELRHLYQRCHLVHGDFSEYNILYHEDRCVIIDVGQAMDITSPQADELLQRDVHVITLFFRKRGETIGKKMAPG